MASRSLSPTPWRATPIVAKVDELMALCDRLEAARNERESRRDRLLAASLHRLSQSAEGDDAFRANACFYFKHLPRLTTRPDHVKQLRQAILNLAVRGRLVPQDPNDEPASELLKWIAADNSERANPPPKQKGYSEGAFGRRSAVCGTYRLALGGIGDLTISRDGDAHAPYHGKSALGARRSMTTSGASGIIDKIDNYCLISRFFLSAKMGELVNRSTPIAFIAHGKYWVCNHAHVLDGLSEHFLRYLQLFINATDLTPYVTGTAQPKMNQQR